MELNLKKFSPNFDTGAFEVVGLMSGTSLDGLDIAYILFQEHQGNWTFNCLDAQTYGFNEDLRQRLLNVYTGTALDLARLHYDFGGFSANVVMDFLSKIQRKPHLIASHGQTVFHNPAEGYTFQLGSGAVIAAITGIPTVADFRSTDVALGGQGAPLVPIGDELLFSDYDFCINLGGFSNISFRKNEKRIAFDIVPVNIVLNTLAQRVGLNYDKDGDIARSGKIINKLLNKLNSLPFFKLNPPKSLGREWVETNVFPLLTYEYKTEDLLCTYTEHIVMQLSDVLRTNEGESALITGGGAHNSYLLERLKSHSSKKIIIPDQKIIDFKEAIIFAFLGLLRALEKSNCLNSVTGASRNSCSGAIYLH